MKKVTSFVCFIILILALIGGAFGCGRSVKGNETYYLYVYDMNTASFVKLPASVTFNSDLSEYEYVFNDGSMTIRGAASHETAPDRYTLTCSEDAITIVTKRYEEQLIAAGASEQEINDFKLAKEGLTPQMQLLYSDGYLFSAGSVELFHATSSGRTDVFEGEFIMTGDGKKVSFKGGSLYTADDKGAFTVLSGYYTVNNGIMTVTMTDKDGKETYTNGLLSRKKYLMVTVSFGDEFELVGTDFEDQMEGSEWLKMMKSDLAAYTGKKYALLTDEFYSTELD